MTGDAISGLPRLRWRGIMFPFDDLQTDTQHRQARHRMPDRNGAMVEDIGLSERMISGQAKFLNGIVFEPTEYKIAWFPDVFDLFIAACEDRTTGDLIHPTKGTLRCKVAGFKESVRSGTRDGAIVDVTWVEDTEDTEDSIQETSSAPLAEAVSAAVALDAHLIETPVPGVPDFSFSDAMNTIRGSLDTASLISKRGAGYMDRVQYNLDQLAGSVERLNDAALNRVRHDIERLQAALYAARRTLKKTAEVAFYIVPGPTTLGGLATKLKAKVTDLITLNTALAGAPIIPARTVIRYYGVG